MPLLVGNDFANSLDAFSYGNSNDSLYGYGGNDSLYGRDGNDYMVGGSGFDKLWGDNGDDSLWGGDDSDTLWGGSGNDYLLGGNGGSETNNLNDGSDTLYGGGGRDTLVGGTGERMDSNIFILDNSYKGSHYGGYATIQGFRPHRDDHLHIVGHGIDTIKWTSSSGYTLKQNGSDVLIKYEGTNDWAAKVTDISIADLQDNIVFG